MMWFLCRLTVFLGLLLVLPTHTANGRRGMRPRGDRLASAGRSALTLHTSAATGVKPRVTVRCEEGSMSVAVPLDLFGTGYLVNAKHLRLGNCSFSRVEPRNGTLLFRTPLHQCGARRTLDVDDLIYKTSLHYLPPVKQIIVRTNPVTIPIECHYPRKGNVSGEAIEPTWVPFSSTHVGHNSLKFFLALMTENWTEKRDSNIYYLGDEIHIEASVVTLNHVPLKLFIDRCVATVGSEWSSNSSYTIIDHNGCLLDSKAGSSTSSFVNPRVKPDTIRFVLDAFRFYRIPSSLIYITCHLRVSALQQQPNPLNKACWFHRASRTWSLVTDSWASPVGESAGQSICHCCDTLRCGSPSRAIRRKSREAEFSQATGEVDSMLGPLVIVDPNSFGAAKSGSSVGDFAEQHQAVSDGHFLVSLVLLGALMIPVAGFTVATYRRCV
ncbi:zona pellucida sperm-binding protein 3-like [Chiloscyllium plagiosum]|uniref:zona pellucida sperm-binding protein 3-like n=1 Tax=Chiloscyllium plagiosum TaxID=36176 RepID=UPI001CB80F4E|nr:zona pellucida sperm-binding protein 3-like [Chiloscyllium plagiosum]